MFYRNKNTAARFLNITIKLILQIFITNYNIGRHLEMSVSKFDMLLAENSNNFTDIT